VAKEPKPAEEPAVSEQISGDGDARQAADDGSVRDESIPSDTIPDAEVVEEPADRAPEPEHRVAAPERIVSETVAPHVPPPPPRRSGAFMGFVTGGVIAAGAGFGLARYFPDVLPIGNSQALMEQVQAQSTEMTDLKAQIDALAARETPDPTAGLDALKADLDARLAALPPPPDPAVLAAEARSAAEAGLAELESRLSAIEKRPAGPGGGVSDAALAAYDRELQALKAAVEDQGAAGAGAAEGLAEELKALAASTESQLAAATSEAEKLRAEAEAAGKAVMAQAAVTRVLAALDAGGPFTSAVTELTETGHEVPAVLVDAAATGIPTLPDLQRSFPDAARAALDAALKADMGESWTDRVAAYLRTQTGARSLKPLEGNDPDAVLSRAEAALEAGEVGTALTELTALPEAAQPALADWTAAASQREAASAAVAALSTALNAE
jgi:hypothetical protein